MIDDMIDEREEGRVCERERSRRRRGGERHNHEHAELQNSAVGAVEG